jgi:hypothetical protein
MSRAGPPNALALETAGPIEIFKDPGVMVRGRGQVLPGSLLAIRSKRNSPALGPGVRSVAQGVR